MAPDDEMCCECEGSGEADDGTDCPACDGSGYLGGE